MSIQRNIMWFWYIPQNTGTTRTQSMSQKLCAWFCGALLLYGCDISSCHYDVIKWKHFRHYWPFVRGIHSTPVNSLHKGQWWGALMFSLICVWKNGWVNNREAGDLRRYYAHYNITVMWNYIKHLSIYFWVASQKIQQSYKVWAMSMIIGLRRRLN